MMNEYFSDVHAPVAGIVREIAALGDPVIAGFRVAAIELPGSASDAFPIPTTRDAYANLPSAQVWNVAQVHASVGDAVEEDQLLLSLVAGQDAQEEANKRGCSFASLVWLAFAFFMAIVGGVWYFANRDGDTTQTANNPPTEQRWR